MSDVYRVAMLLDGAPEDVSEITAEDIFGAARRVVSEDSIWGLGGRRCVTRFMAGADVAVVVSDYDDPGGDARDVQLIIYRRPPAPKLSECPEQTMCGGCGYAYFDDRVPGRCDECSEPGPVSPPAPLPGGEPMGMRRG